MSKNETKTTINWTLTNDGMKPTPAPWGYIVRNPLVKSLPPGASMSLNLQVSADFPMLAWPAQSHTTDLTVPMIIVPGQDVVVTVTNTSQYSMLTLESAEPLVNLHPLMHVGSLSEVK